MKNKQTFTKIICASFLLVLFLFNNFAQAVSQEEENKFEVILQTPFFQTPELPANCNTLKTNQARAACNNGLREWGIYNLKQRWGKNEKGKENFEIVEDDKKDLIVRNPQTDETWHFFPDLRDNAGVWKQVIQGGDGEEILKNYTKLIYVWLAGFIGIASVLMLVFGGIEISTAGANQEGVSSGTKRIVAALSGIALLFLSSLILRTINPTFFI
jgi:hypothetical protein